MRIVQLRIVAVDREQEIVCAGGHDLFRIRRLREAQAVGNDRHVNEAERPRECNEVRQIRPDRRLAARELDLGGAVRAQHS